MKLFILKRISGEPMYDVVNGLVVRAPNENYARMLAVGHCGDEGEEVWANEATSSCDELTINGLAETVLIDFSAG